MFIKFKFLPLERLFQIFFQNFATSQGGSFTTAKEIVAAVYDWKAPMYLQYDFVSIKGMGGKMSSSKGNLVTVNDVLDVYEPEMVRWIFASYKTNIDFGLSFDLDVIKIR